MKKQEIYGEGLRGINVEFSFVDMYAMSQMKENLLEVENNRKEIDAYNSVPYDQRKDLKRPDKVDVDDNTIHQLINMLSKLTIQTEESDLFKDEENHYSLPA